MNNDKISNLEFGFLSTFLYKAFILLNGFNIIINITLNDSIISYIIDAEKISFILRGNAIQ